MERAGPPRGRQPLPAASLSPLPRRARTHTCPACAARSAICTDWKRRSHGTKDGFRAVTGLPVSTYFSCYKFQWLWENVAAVREAAEAGR
jgi:hypothetical protein